MHRTFTFVIIIGLKSKILKNQSQIQYNNREKDINNLDFAAVKDNFTK